MNDKKELQKILKRIDGKGYKAYTDIKGSYKFEYFTLHIDHVQRDPFAGPSLIRIEVQESSFPRELIDNHEKRIAVSDFIARAFNGSIKKHTTGRSGSGKSGIITIDNGGQEILERSCVNICQDNLEVRFSIGLPARGRRIMGRESSRIFFEVLPLVVNDSCFFKNLDKNHLIEEVELFEDANFIRNQLKSSGLVAFVRDGSILPRGSGVTDKPLKNAVQFKTLKNLEVIFETPNHGYIRGMGIPKGVNLIVGGGYHGKSTLLQAIERGVYNHIYGMEGNGL